MTHFDEYYRADLARVYAEAFGYHADNCAPGLLALLEPIRARKGTILEIGCGTGLLTRRLVDAGHRVIASDASPDMLRHAARLIPDAEEIRQIRLPADSLPTADAIIGIGNVLNYLDSEAAVLAALTAIAKALRPGGLVALDMCDLAWGEAHRNAADKARLGNGWAMITRFSIPRRDRFIFDFTIFTDDGKGTWRRDDERHEIILVDTARLAVPLRRVGLQVSIGRAFGSETLPPGLVTIIGHHSANEPSSCRHTGLRQR